MATGDHGPASGRAHKPTAFPKRREGVAAQVVTGEAVLLDIESGEYFSLNPVGGRIWELCDGTRSTAEIVSVMCDEYDVALDVVTADTMRSSASLRTRTRRREAEGGLAGWPWLLRCWPGWTCSGCDGAWSRHRALAGCHRPIQIRWLRSLAARWTG